MKFSTLWVVLLSLVIVACNGGDNRTNIEVVPNMFDQVSLKAQDWDPNKDGKGSQLLPPENTVPRGKAYPRNLESFDAADKKLKNPMAGNLSPEIMELGKKNYQIYCSMCHGDTGNGKGLVGAKMIVPPRNFLDENVKAYSDGRIYWAIAKGFGTMGSYANQIHTESARWAVVNYVRALQKQGQ